MIEFQVETIDFIKNNCKDILDENILKLFEHMKRRHLWDSSACDDECETYYELDSDIVNLAMKKVVEMAKVINAVERINSDVLNEAEFLAKED